MYAPKPFAVEDRDALDGVIHDNPFGLLVGTLARNPSGG